MTEPFESDAHDYLLHQMDPVRRAAFEAELERDPAARAALKAEADALAAFGCAVAGEEALSATAHRTTLATILAAATGDARARQPAGRSRIPRQRFLWPAAALLLVALNLIEFERPFAPGPAVAGRRPPAGEAAGSVPPDATLAPSARPETSAEANEPASSRQTPTAPTPAATPTLPPAETERLRTSVVELEREVQRWRVEYFRMREQLAELERLNGSLHRLSTMELVDSASYARGERKGLVTVGRGLLTEPGIVVASEAPVPPGTTAQSTARAPYAWSVFDEQERRGYLNLYNLPQLPDDQSLQVWVRPTDGTPLQRVAEVAPRLHGGNGTVQYALPGTAAAPAEILITIEPRNAIPAAPLGPVILRGP